MQRLSGHLSLREKTKVSEVEINKVINIEGIDIHLNLPSTIENHILLTLCSPESIIMFLMNLKSKEKGCEGFIIH